MHYIESTYKILAWSHLNRMIDEKWSSWAIDQINFGIDTESIVELAGIDFPNDQKYLRKLVNSSFLELGLNVIPKSDAICNYVSYLIYQYFRQEAKMDHILYEIYTIGYETGYDKRFESFMFLYNTYTDLIENNVQFDWNGATRENIHEIIEQTFNEWLINYPIE